MSPRDPTSACVRLDAITTRAAFLSFCMARNFWKVVLRRLVCRRLSLLVSRFWSGSKCIVIHLCSIAWAAAGLNEMSDWIDSTESPFPSFWHVLPRLRILLEQVAHKLLCSWADVIPLRRREIKLSSSYGVKDFSVWIAIKGRITAQQNISDDTNWPNVTAFCVFSPQHFWGNVIGGACVRENDGSVQGWFIVFSE